jgi:hypothetical protein
MRTKSTARRMRPLPVKARRSIPVAVLSPSGA